AWDRTWPASSCGSRWRSSTAASPSTSSRPGRRRATRRACVRSSTWSSCSRSEQRRAAGHQPLGAGPKSHRVHRLRFSRRSADGDAVEAVPFQVPRVRLLVRHAFPRVLEGTIIPVAVFVLALHFVGVTGAIAAGLAWTYSAIGVRLATGRRVPGILILGAMTLTARSILTFATGSTFVYFLQPTLGTAMVACAFLVSVPTGRPLVQRL